jgi:hypothetical protein
MLRSLTFAVTLGAALCMGAATQAAVIPIGSNLTPGTYTVGPPIDFSGSTNSFTWSTALPNLKGKLTMDFEFANSNTANQASPDGATLNSVNDPGFSKTGVSGDRAMFMSGQLTLATAGAYEYAFKITNASLNSSTNHTATLVITPLPAAAWMFGAGLVGLAGFARRKRAQVDAV